MERSSKGDVWQTKEHRLRTLLLAGLDGDASAYRQFLTALGDHLRGFLRRRLSGQLSDVEDLVQEVLLAVHNARVTYRAEQPVTAWVQAIARYKLVDYFRSRARHDALNDPIDTMEDLFEAESREAADASRDLGKLLETLPDKQRLPIVHVKLEGHSVADTAQMTGLSESAVKIGIHRGLKVLAAKLRVSL
jgi:RNA polymerase sigma-70 factor (ECF subfamily)